MLHLLPVAVVVKVEASPECCPPLVMLIEASAVGAEVYPSAGCLPPLVPNFVYLAVLMQVDPHVHRMDLNLQMVLVRLSHFHLFPHSRALSWVLQPYFVYLVLLMDVVRLSRIHLRHPHVHRMHLNVLRQHDVYQHCSKKMQQRFHHKTP